jgi:hypothetical protein
MPPAMQHAHHEESGLVDSLGSAPPNSASSYVPTTVGISHSFVSPGMWQDSVAAATAFSDSGKRMFPFGGGDGWSNPPSTHGMTSTAPAGTAVRVNGSSRGH